MPSPSVTHTFANSTTADATQVNTNFTDIINGLTDGSKDLSISALTLAGNFTANGTTNTIGSASNDDLVVNASLASSIPIKTTNLYNIGSSTVGLLGAYFGSSGGAFTTLVKGGAVGTSYTLTLPLTGGTSSYNMRTNGSGTLTFQAPPQGSISNYGITCSVGSNALTIALKDAGGSDASATSPIDFIFRNATSATGTPSLVSATAAASLTISSGSTLGHASGADHYIYVYAINNAGTVELAASTAWFDDGSIISTTAEGAAGAADSNRVIYSGTARSNVACRKIARLKSNQVTAGTWALVPSEISLLPFDRIRTYAQYTTTAGTAFTSGSGATDVPFATKVKDSHNFFSSPTATIPEAGVYRVTANIFTSSTNPSATQSVFLLFTIGAGAQYLSFAVGNGSSHAHWISATKSFEFAAGDTIKIQLDTDFNFSLNTTSGRNYIEIERISGL